ncbi:MAG: hypothetical protein LUQ04_07320 [Methanoregula sp.]|nr:hypothetical protein [Methanoregula sp.]
MDLAWGCFLPILEYAPAEVYDMNTVKRDCFFIIAVCFLLLLLVVPVCASPFPVVIRGTILELNETDQTLLLQAD